MSSTTGTNRDASVRERAIIAASLAGVASLCFAALCVRHDGWLAPRTLGVAWDSLGRHLTAVRPLAVCAGSLALALLIGRARAPLPQLVAAAVFFVAATGHWIEESESTPTWSGAAGLAGNLGVALLALVLPFVAGAIARRVRGRRPAARVAALAVLAIAASPFLIGGVARLGVSTAPRQRDGRTSVVIVSLDTLRGDRVGCYGHARDTTPGLDAFAKDAVRFERALTPFPFTLTAHASLFTSLDPAAHGAIQLGPKIDERLPMFRDVPTLAQAFRAAGYVTVGVVDSCLWLQPKYGLSAGFDVWRVIVGDAKEKAAILDDLVADLRGRPCLLFLHCFDIHSDWRQLPYESAPEDRGAYSQWYRGPFDGSDPAFPGQRASHLLREWNNAGASVPDDVVRYVSDLYDEGIRSTDRVIAAFLGRLDAAGFRDRAVVAITADHGEEFREHGRFLHDAQLFDESIRVPLLLRLPRAEHAGSAIATPVSLVDLAPTLAELAQVPFEGGQGRSLVPLIRDGGGEDAPIFLGALTGEAGESGVVLGRFKLLKRGETTLLFDLAEDPQEKRDVAAARPEVVRSLTLQLETRRAENAAKAAERTRGGALSISDAERRKINAIGY